MTKMRRNATSPSLAPYPRRESNPHFKFRKPTFYPLNYGDARGSNLVATVQRVNFAPVPASSKQKGPERLRTPAQIWQRLARFSQDYIS